MKQKIGWIAVGLWCALLIAANFLPYGVLPVDTGNSATNSATLSVAQVQQQLLSVTPTSAASLVTPTAANWCGAFPKEVNSGSYGYSYNWYIKNLASTQANSATVSGGTGVTVNGVNSPGLVPTGSVKFYKVVMNCGIPAITLVPLGSNTY